MNYIMHQKESLLLKNLCNEYNFNLIGELDSNLKSLLVSMVATNPAERPSVATIVEELNRFTEPKKGSPI